jgi:hypothetical protein
MNEQEIKEMITFYDGKETILHIKLSNGRFYNGIFVEWETPQVMVLDDRVLGMIHIFLSQIVSIEEYKKEKEK